MRPWFERLWVQQEIRLANDDTILMCGFYTVLWRSFAKAIYCMNVTFTKYPSEDDGPKFHSRIQMLFSMCRYCCYMSPGQFSQDIRFSKCSDPRDRVYAVLNLLDRDDEGSVGI